MNSVIDTRPVLARTQPRPWHAPVAGLARTLRRGYRDNAARVNLTALEMCHGSR